jgi:hypothetical protein
MSYQQFQVSLVNPNDTHGGGGCACDPRKQEDCKPPYIVIQDNEMLDHLSPRVVICKACVAGFAKALDGEALEIGERDPKAVQPDPTAAAHGDENPEVDASELLAALKAKHESPDE